MAGKIKDDPVKIRDVINVAHSTLNRGASPLELGDEYWSMRDAIVQAELLIARTLKFDLNIEHPHKVRIVNNFVIYKSVFNCTVLCSNSFYSII